MRRDLWLATAVAAVVAGAAHGFTRVFATGDWRPTTYAAAGLALLVAVGVRRLAFGTLAAALSSLVGLVVLTYVVHLPAGPLVPGPEQLRQAVELAGEGILQAQEEPAPAPVLPGLLLLVTSGTWLVTHLSHELLVRARRAGLALLPAVVLWAVPLAAPQPTGRTWTTALPFLAGAALLLLVDAETEVGGSEPPVGWLPSRAGLTVGSLAVVLAALVPGALPGYQAEPWWDLGGGRDAPGYQPIVDVGDRLRLPSDRPVLEVRADRKVYLRLAGLDSFDRFTWRIGPPGVSDFRPDPSQVHRVRGELPFETPIAAGQEVEVGITVLDLENIYLPVPYQPLEVVEGGEGMLYSTVGGFVASTDLASNELGGKLAEGVRTGKSYEVVSYIPDPAPEDLRRVAMEPAEVGPWLQLPTEYPALRETAEGVFASAGAENAYDRALALQDWFHDPEEFRYSTSDVGPLVGESALETFVLEHRVGYCEYFASAMAVMLRETGIPARVAVGFAPGRLTLPADPAVGRDHHTYEVSTSDAHAWVEVLFPGHGWVTFDPTPRSDGNVMPATADDVLPGGTLADGTDERAAPIEEEEVVDAPTDLPSEDVPRALERDVVGSDASAERRSPWLIVALGLLGTILAAFGLAAVRLRPHHPGLPPEARVLAAQRRVHTIARRYGVGRAASETGVEVAERWIAEGRVEPSAAERLAELGQRAAFGGEVEPTAGEEAEALAETLVGGLRSSVPTRTRVLAPVRVPAETVAGMSSRLAEPIRRRAAGERLSSRSDGG